LSGFPFSGNQAKDIFPVTPVSSSVALHDIAYRAKRARDMIILLKKTLKRAESVLRENPKIKGRSLS
jgi:hypothetical protein